VAVAVAYDFEVGFALGWAAHKAFVEAVEISLVVILLPFSLLLSSQSLHLLRLLLSAAVPFAVDS
jgi:hypothetical protein